MSGPGCEPGSVDCCAPNRSFPHWTAAGARAAKSRAPECRRRLTLDCTHPQLAARGRAMSGVPTR
jgi:hypothetical protein